MPSTFKPFSRGRPNPDRELLTPHRVSALKLHSGVAVHPPDPAPFPMEIDHTFRRKLA